MNLQVKRKEAARRASYSFGNVEPLGRIATRKVYHKNLGLVKPFLSVCLLFLIILVCIKLHCERYPMLSEVEHKVTCGDTLWGIAKEYKPDGMSMSVYMDWVYRRNGDGVIYPGDVVVMGVVN